MELDMTKGSPSKLITKFIIPIIIGNISSSYTVWWIPLSWVGS